MRLRRVLPLLIVLGTPGQANAASVQLPAPGMLKADGSITALTRVGSRIVVSGSFRHIGPYVGGAVGLDAQSGARDPGFARLDGQVSDAIPDGSGGWYVGGQFLVSGARRAVAHVLASGDVDPKFDATVGTFVTSLALDGETLYAGRYFWNSEKDRGVVALDRTTGARRAAFRPPTGGSGVTELLHTPDRLYVGQDGVYAVVPETGFRNTVFDCDECPEHVTALALVDDVLYVGGRGGVIAVDHVTGRRIKGFAAPVVTSGERQGMDTLVFHVDGERLIVGGGGLRLGGPSSTLVALDLGTGAADPSFGRGFSNPIHDMVVDGGSLLVAGAPRPGRTAPVIRLDRATGAYQDALVPKLDGPIDALAGGGRRLFVGGRFGTAHGIGTDGVAAVDARSGQLVPGFAVHDMPDMEFPVKPLVAGDSLIFPWSDAGAARAVAFSARTGARRRAFAPHPLFPTDEYGAAWAADSDHVFASYETGKGEGGLWTQASVSVLSAHSGARLAHYRLPYPGSVNDLLIHHGQLFVTGSFRRYFSDGRPRHLATMALNPMTGAIDDGFDAHTDGPVNSVVGYRDRLYLSGYFDHAYGLRRDGQSSAYDNTGAVVAGFSDDLGVSGVSDGLLQAYSTARNYRMVAADPYSGRIRFGVPAIRPGFTGQALATQRGMFVTATLDLPWYYGGYDNYAVLLRTVG